MLNRASIRPGFLCVLLVALAPTVITKAKTLVDGDASDQAVLALAEELESLDAEPNWLAELATHSEAQVPLTADDAQRAADLLWDEHARRIRKQRAAEMKERVIELDDARMPFFLKRFGQADDKGRSLFISMHGGGGAPTGVNDQQWENQKRLYEPTEGVYIAPRAPSDEWDLWHRKPVSRLFDRLIENLIVLENVDPNRVYVMGYSAGGDGTYQLAPRMADRWAAAAMMAGHPNEVTPHGLRNVAFILQMGGRDAAYDRNKIAAQWKEELAKLRKDDPQGYDHLVKIYPNKGHWMDREDAMALPWMAKFVRNPIPNRVVWKQDDVTRNRFYWLTVPQGQAVPHSIVEASYHSGRREILITSDKATGLTIYLNDNMGALEEPWTITLNGKKQSATVPRRTIATLAKSLRERGDRELMFAAELPAM